MSTQNRLYDEAIANYGAALWRLVHGYERDAEHRRDLLQEIHIALWRSLRSFDGRCSLRTWVYRVAHNVSASHLVRNGRISARLVSLDEADPQVGSVDGVREVRRRESAAVLLELIHRLKPLDRQILMLHLEGETAVAIAETCGLSAINVATKVHRVKKLLQRQFYEGVSNAKE